MNSFKSNNLIDLYQILGVPHNATAKQIKAAYYEKAKQHHPDASKDSTDAIKFQQISSAYETLSDLTKRREYDAAFIHGDDRYNPAAESSTRAARSPYDTWAAGAREPRYSEPRVPMKKPFEPIDMNHIAHVYKTLNKVHKEPYTFRPHADHMYPDTTFNKFEFDRVWNRQSNSWAFFRKSSISKYHEMLKKGHKRLSSSIGIATLVCLACSSFGMALWGMFENASPLEGDLIENFPYGNEEKLYLPKYSVILRRET